MVINKRGILILLFLLCIANTILFKKQLLHILPIRAKTVAKNEINSTKMFLKRHIQFIKGNNLLVTCQNDNEIEIYSLLSPQILLTKFEKKPWGTWNIEGWFDSNDWSIPSKDNTLLAGGGSDWEYVFRVRTNKDEDYVFSGGNHGNEILKSLKILNPDNNSVITLSKGKKVTLKKLKIEEETFLTSRDNESSKYAEVKRIYTIIPSRINLETDFSFTSDIYMETSYVCMLPISKEYGRYIRFNDSGDIYITPPVGETLTTDKFENYIGKEKALSVDIWGDAMPSYRFNINIGNPEMVDNFHNKLKTFYWDMSKEENKLYFSKFDIEAKIIKGTKWKDIAEWNISIKK